MTTTGTEPDRSAVTARRRIRRARGLPGGRAVVGALLVSGAAVGVFAAYLSATADPSTSYLVAGGTIEPGTRFETVDHVLDVVMADAVDLSPDVAARMFTTADVDQLVGRVVIVPLEYGDPITRTAVVDDGGVADAHTMSIPIERSDAVAGSLRAGERIDILATFGTGDNASTAYVARGVPILRITGGESDALGDRDEMILTVAITALEDVQALGHAINTASVFVTRSQAQPGDRDTPGAYRFDPEAEGPVSDPASDPVGGLDTPPTGASDPGGADGSGSDDAGDPAQSDEPSDVDGDG